MTVKEYLSQLKNIQLRINAIQRRIDRFHDKATRITSTISDTPLTHGNGNKIEDNAIEKSDLKTELEQLKYRYQEVERKITLEINRIPDNLYSALLFERYVNGLTWEQVADAINADVDYTRKVLHVNAMASFVKYNYQKRNP